MPHYRYLIVGAGMTGDAAVRGIREVDCSGPIGLIAAALTMTGGQVVMLFPEDGIGSRLFPAGLAQALNQYYGEKGVEVLAGELVSGMTATSGNTVLTTTSGRRIDVGGVVAGLGIL